MEPGSSSAADRLNAAGVEPARPVHRRLHFFTRQLLRLTSNIQGLGAFGLITLGVAATKFNQASKLIHPLIAGQIYRAGIRLLPLTLFVALALGLVVIGQTVSLLTRVGAQNLAGTIMVIVVVREMGPILAALLVLARVGTATVIELGHIRAAGQVEALEALGIDPIHYLVVPRVIGLVVATLALTVYLVLGALAAGYFFAFLQDVPLTLSDYLNQIASRLGWPDFVFLALKTTAFGAVISLVCCYQGLARPLRLEEVSNVTTQAVVTSFILCVGVDALFIIMYLLA